MSAPKYCDDPDHCNYSDCPTAFCDRDGSTHSLHRLVRHQPMKTQKTMLWPPRNFQWRCQLEWKLQDFWIGAFWKRQGHCIDLWVCLLPCVPLHISWWWTREPMMRSEFLKLPMHQRRKILESCCTEEMVKHYEGVNDV